MSKNFFGIIPGRVGYTGPAGPAGSTGATGPAGATGATGAAGADGADGGAVSVAILTDEKSSGTGGGTFSKDAWRVRDLNTIQSDIDNIVTLSANEFTLQTGTYEISWWCSAYDCNDHRSRIYNETDASVAISGINGFNHQAYHGGSPSLGTGVIVIASAKDFSLEHYCDYTGDFGRALSEGVEVYANVNIRKIS